MSPALLDTCALLWWTLDPKQLSPKAKAACKKIENSVGYVSSVSIWEIGVKIKNQKLSIGMPIERYVENLAKISGLVILSTDLAVWLKSLSLEWAHKDPADRLIVSTALLNDFHIITNDKIIGDFYPKCTF